MAIRTPNEIEIDGGTVKIRVDSKTNGTKYVLVDLIDYIALNLRDYRWCVRPDYKAFYAVAHVGKTMVQMHRLILPDAVEVDHEDHNGLNNTRRNLRPVTHHQNLMNTRMQSNNKSGVKGVCWNKRTGKWMASIRAEGRNINLGTFEDIEDAKAARFAAAEKYFGEYAHEVAS